MTIKRVLLSTKQGHLLVKLNDIMLGMILFCMVMPDDFYNAICLYESSTPTDIDYKWLDYKFGVVQLLIVIIGILIMVLRKINFCVPLYAYFLFREMFFEYNVFQAGAYEIYLSLFVGICLTVCTIYVAKDIKSLRKIFYWLLVSNILTVYLGLLLKISVDGNRYHAANLDVGWTGVLSAITILYVLEFAYKRAIDYIVIILSGGALLLSGARSSLVIMVLCVFLKYFFEHHEGKNISKKKWLNSIIIVFILILGGTIAATLFWKSLSEEVSTSRIFTSLLPGKVKTDSSVIGRTKSILIGLDIIKENIFGISGFFINLQRNTRLRGFSTFPHSDFICFYLMYGPIVIGIYMYMIYIILKGLFERSQYCWSVCFLVAYTIVSGGAEINFKSYYFAFLLLYLFVETNKMKGQNCNA